MASLTFNFAVPTPTPASYKVLFRLKGSSDPYVTVLGVSGPPPITVTHGGIVFGEDYEGFVVADCTDIEADQTPYSSDEYHWEPDTGICEQDAIYTLIGQVATLSSPAFLYYDEISGIVYGVDDDNVSGNFFYYDPNSISGPSDITYIPMVLAPGAQNYVYAYTVDKENRRIIAVGKDTNGVQIYNIATGTVSVVVCGPNHNVSPSVPGNGFNRLFVTIMDNDIVTYNSYNKTYYFINRTTLMVGTTKVLAFGANSVPWLTKLIEGNIWVNGGGNPDIQVYDPTFTTVLTTISLGAYSAIWTNGTYWRSFFFDENRHRLYMVDFGGKNLVVIDTVLRVVVYSHTFNNRLGKTNVALQFIENPVSTKFYLSGNFTDDANTDLSPIPVTYEFDRDTNELTRYLEGLSFANLTRIANTNVVHGPSAGLTAWAGGAWATDGEIQFFTT